MSDVRISGYGDDLTIDDVRIGDLSPAEIGRASCRERV